MALRWAAQRQMLYALIVLAVVIVLGVWGYFSIFYKTASCFDNVQNQDELGIDCGGTCSLLCEAPNISSVWARSVEVAPGVYHAVSMVRNPDTTSKGSIAYAVSLFDEENILIATREGNFNLAPGEVTPIFEANIIAGERKVSRTFIDILEGQFEKSKREESQVRILSWNLDEENLRLSAVVENQSVVQINNVVITALIFDDNEVLIAASQTKTGLLEQRERKTVNFTWQKPFDVTPKRIDIIPRIEL